MTLRDTIKELCKRKGLSVNKLEADLGFAKGYVSKLDKSIPNSAKLQSIAEYFNVSLDFLMNGDEQSRTTILSKKDEREITKILEQTKEKLLLQEGLMFDGNPASQEAIESILSAMEIGMEIAKKKNKELYTPKKYKKD